MSGTAFAVLFMGIFIIRFLPNCKGKLMLKNIGSFCAQDSSLLNNVFAEVRF